MLVSTSVNIGAKDMIDKPLERELIAVNVPNAFGCNYEWNIVKTTPLYNFDDQIIAYCYDMESNNKISDNKPIRSYAVINATPNGSTVLMCGFDGISPYFDIELDKAYFFGALEYYGNRNGQVYNLQTDKTISSEAISRLSSQYMNTLAVSSQKQRTIYSSQQTQNANASNNWQFRSLDSVPNLQWAHGCAPTAVAMMIMSKAPYLNSDYVISTLANLMQTKPDGSTPFLNIPYGTYSCITQLNVGTAYYCNWVSVDMEKQIPRVGFSVNTKEIFKESIDYGCPVGVYISSSDVITEAYNGFSAHMMTGIGYSYNHTGPYLVGDYIICYTTSPRDGAVLFPMNDSALHNVAWFLLRWKI